MDPIASAGLVLLEGWGPGMLAPGAERERALHVAVGGAGVLLLAYAGWARAGGRATPVQGRGLAAAGFGFVLSALASTSLRAAGALGPIVALGGSLLVLWGMLTLVRERHRLRQRGHLPGLPLPPAARRPRAPDDPRA